MLPQEDRYSVPQLGRSIRRAFFLTPPRAPTAGPGKSPGLHPDVQIWTAAIDGVLDDQGFILPGLADAGDRAYGTNKYCRPFSNPFRTMLSYAYRPPARWGFIFT